MNRKIVLVVALALIGLAACGGSKDVMRDGQHAMDRWESLVRWSQYDALIDLMHPEWLAAHPIPRIDLERLKQFRVSQYRVEQVLTDADNLVIQRSVRIHLYHNHTLRERVILHAEEWRYDAERERWLLHSGLPDPRRR